MMLSTTRIALLSLPLLGMFNRPSLAAPPQPGGTPDEVFEVASVRPSRVPTIPPLVRGQRRTNGEALLSAEKIDASPGNLTMRNVRLISCLQWAYALRSFQVSGPEWLDSERFDIVAKPPRPVPEAKLRLMLRSLLADRFRLAFHSQSKQRSVYALVVGNAPKLRESEGDRGAASTNSKKGNPGVLDAQRTTMTEFAELLSAGPLGTPVINMTGLQGRYDFNLDLSPLLATEGGQRPDPAAIITLAVQKQLGLRLEPRKAPLEILVVDHMDKIPAAN